MTPPASTPGRLTRRQFLGATSVAALAPATLPAATPAPRPARREGPPNLLFVFTDEQRADTLNSPHVAMPRLNALAAQSTVFTNAHVVQPVCTPSRGCMLTGQLPWVHGAVMNNIPLRSDVGCLPELLRSRGRYRTGYFGKWHLGDEIFAQHGFEVWRSTEDGYAGFFSASRDRAALCTHNTWLRGHGFKPDEGERFSRGMATNLPEPFTKPAYLAEETCRFIEAHRDEPFIACVSFLEPHMPFYGRLTERYDSARLALPENFDAPPAADTHLEARLKAELYRRRGFEYYDLSTERGWRQMTAAYRGLCTLVDNHLGRILDTLSRHGLDENTIVVFTSDHGEMMGSHRLLGKSLMYRESTQVPLTIRLPGQTRGRTVSGPVSHLDLVPTLLELLGDTPAGLPGKSLAPVLRGATLPPEDIVVMWDGVRKDAAAGAARPAWMVEFAGGAEQLAQAGADPLRTLITADGWRFTHSPWRGEHELYNWNEDPGETRNLVARAEHQGRIREYRAKLRAWQTRFGDPGPAVS